MVPMSPKEFKFYQKVRNGEIKLFRKEIWHDRHPIFSFLLCLSIMLITVGFIFYFVR
jgi:hypothetical protein